MGMSTHDEALHPRETTGRFATKAVAEASGGMDALSVSDAGEDPASMRTAFTATVNQIIDTKAELRRSTTNRGEDAPESTRLQAQVVELTAKLDEMRAPLRTAAEQKYTTRSAQDAYATCYGDEAYADYLEKAAQENAQRRPGEAEYYLTRTLGDALRGNDGV